MKDTHPISVTGFLMVIVWRAGYPGAQKPSQTRSNAGWEERHEESSLRRTYRFLQTYRHLARELYERTFSVGDAI